MSVLDGLALHVDDHERTSHALSESLLVKGGVPVRVLALSRNFAPSLVAGGGLCLVERLAGVLGDGLVPLVLTVVALCVLIMQPPRSTASLLGSSAAEIATDIFGRWLVLLAALLLVSHATHLVPGHARPVLLAWAVLAPVGMLAAVLFVQQSLRQLMRDAVHHRRVVFAGCNETSLALARRIRERPELCMTVAGFFDDRSAERLGSPDVTLHGSLHGLARYVQQHGVDVIFVALPMRHLKRVQELLDQLWDTTASIYYAPDVGTYDLIRPAPVEICGLPVVAMCETPLYGMHGLWKRLFDVVVASVLLVVLSPLVAAIALAIKLTSPGSVIFRQHRYGLDGRKIIVFKFRTMTVTEDGAHVPQASRLDQRITPVGRLLRRTSLDELPQLFNVLQGTMSLVGPRPHAVAHNEIYRKLIKGYMLRHKVLPGITGLAQIRGCRGETQDVARMEERIRHDLEYLRHWSVTLDIRILLITAARFLFDKNAY